VPYLAAIQIFPVKSLEPLTLHESRVLRSGALDGDRTFAMFDAEGKFINGKRNAAVHTLRSKYDPFTGELRLGRHNTGLTAAFHVDRQREKIEAWLAEYFGMAVSFRRNTEVGFPDDLEAPGPTVISTATLAEVAGWMPPLDVAQIRVRFRANLEIGGVPAFWEDRLYGPKPQRVAFQIGDVTIHGNNPCRRCVVPPRDPLTGQGYPEFTNTFRARREQALPAWAEKSRFDHYYRLAVNTVIPASEAGMVLRVGDEVRVIGLCS
jgi:hypothetical protein